MSKTMTFNVACPEEQFRWLSCRRCTCQTSHKVLAIAAATDTSPNGKSHVWINSMIMQCQGCRLISFCEETQQTGVEQWDPVARKWNMAVFTKTYPPCLTGRSWLPHLEAIPTKVQFFYRETYTALCNELHLLTSVGIRSTIEAVCKEQGMKGKDLKEQINALVVTGILNQKHADILHNLRFMGNRAVHETKINSKEELCTAFDVVEHMLEGIYILPKLAHKLPKQRKKHKSVLNQENLKNNCDLPKDAGQGVSDQN
jgi:hypothetical protein